ncbi:MAG: DedA family protein [Candidatus Aenigmarchaeota archaeon]|nr:DedA family protein [Candidatus Aenigmarchaeota archaeon]
MVVGIEQLIGLVDAYGYPAVFVVGFLSSFTLFIPSPAFIVVFLFGAKLNPVLLGTIAGAGAALGETTSYIAGYGIRKIAKNQRKKLDEIRKLVHKYRPEVVIFIFSATPLPFDFVGIFCGTINFDRKKFFVATLLGKIIKFIFIAYAGFYGISWVADSLQG